jgi:hypothetical protein
MRTNMNRETNKFHCDLKIEVTQIIEVTRIIMNGRRTIETTRGPMSTFDLAKLLEELIEDNQ